MPGYVDATRGVGGGGGVRLMRMHHCFPHCRKCLGFVGIFSDECILYKMFVFHSYAIPMFEV